MATPLFSRLDVEKTLAEIEASLPKAEEETEEEETEDPRQELVERLLEYKMYKYASLELSDRQLDAGRVLFKEGTLPPEIADYKDVPEQVAIAKTKAYFNAMAQLGFSEEQVIDYIKEWNK